MAINPKIKQKAEDIRSKIFGSEVRESLASGIEAISEDVEATISRQDYVEEQFQNVIDETTDKDVISAPELIAARNGEANLKTRLDKENQDLTAQLQQTEQELSSQLAQTAKYGINLNRWGIKNNGTDANATTIGINNALQWASENGYNEVHLQAGTYLIDGVNELKTDAAKRNEDAGIMIPSGISFIMSPDTILKIKPNNSASYTAISLSQTQNNIKIIGGQILGDRKTHDYTGDPNRSSHEWGYGIFIRGSSNVLVEGVMIKDCTGDSILVKSPGIIGSGNYVAPSRIRINNCVLDSARRNNISLTGCEHVIIENCQILNAGIDDGIKDGTIPKFGIDIEGYGEGDVDYETPIKIVIRNNKFVGNVNSSVSNHSGYEVVISDNFSDSSISYGNGTDTVIANNVLKRTDKTKSGILANRISNGETGNHTTVVGNTVNGFAVGLDIRGGNVTVSGNTVNNVETGINVYNATQILVAGNTVTKCSKEGIAFRGCDKVTVTGNSIRDIERTVLNIATLNTEINIQNNLFENFYSAVFAESGNINIRNNIFNKGVLVSAVCMTIRSNVSALIEGNKITHDSYNVILVNAGNNTGEISIFRNIISNNRRTINLSVNAKYEVVGNMFKSNMSDAPLANGSNAIYLGAGVDGAQILENTFKSLSPYPYGTPIHTFNGTNSKIIKNLTLNGGSIYSSPTDSLESNLMFDI